MLVLVNEDTGLDGMALGVDAEKGNVEAAVVLVDEGEMAYMRLDYAVPNKSVGSTRRSVRRCRVCSFR